jgi:hypothetical protein
VDARSTQGVIARAILAVASISNGVIGVWATFSPRGWYDDFPGFGKVWVAVDGPFNEHLVRDIGSWSLALTVLTLAAAWTLDRRLVLVAGLALVAQNLPHAQYHLDAPNPFDSRSEQLQSVSGIVLLVALGALLVGMAWRGRGRGATASGSRGSRGSSPASLAPPAPEQGG